MIWGSRFLERMHLHGGCSTTWKTLEKISCLLHQRMGIPKFQPLISGGVCFSPSTNPFRNFLQLMKTSWNPSEPIGFTICNLLRDAKGVYFNVSTLKKIPTLADIYHLKQHMERILIVILQSTHFVPPVVSNRLRGRNPWPQAGHAFPLKNSSWKMTFL